MTCAAQVATSIMTNLLQLSCIRNMMISHKKYNVYSLLTIVVRVLQKKPLNHCAEFLTDRHSLLEVQQLPQLHLTTLKVPCTNVEGSKCRYFRQLLLMFPCVLWEPVMKLATDNRSFEGQSTVLTKEFHVYLPQTRNSICYLLVQNCTSMPLIRQSRDNFINRSPYLSHDKTLFFLSVLY